MTAVALAPDPLEEARQRLAAIWAEERRLAFAPPSQLSVSEWADAYRIVPSYSAEPGRWVTDKTPYLREVMDCFSDPSINRVVFQKCARIGATEAGLNIIGYYIAQDPSPIFVTQPTVEDAKDFSKEQLTPTIEETPALRAIVAEASSRESGNTILAKQFPGGAMYLVGANSPRGFRRRTARVIVLEEVDGYPESAGTEGDQVKLAERRATTFQHRRKIYINSTPTVKGISRIEREFEQSDQRRYEVPCPDCGEYQALRWAQLTWDDGQPQTAAYACQACGVLVPEREKFGMVARGRWVATNPGRTTAGFHLNALYSPWVSWGELADEWIGAQQDAGKLQVFVNTALGESWEDRGGGLDPDLMWANRRESYTTVPAPVGLLTAGVDVQHDRLEVIVRGWGSREESWLIDRNVIMGDPTGTEVWQLLDRYLLKDWPHESGARLRIQTTCIDSGDNQDKVYRYCAPRFDRRVFATKGASDPGKPFIPRRPTRNNKYRCPLFLIGTNGGKGIVYDRLKIMGAPPAAETQAPTKYHFNLTADRDYFDQLTVEKAVKKYVNRRWTRVFTCPAHRRNEVLDCEVMALAALYLSGYAREQLGALAEQVKARQQQKEAGKRQPKAAAPRVPGAKPQQRGGFINRWKPR